MGEIHEQVVRIEMGEIHIQVDQIEICVEDLTNEMLATSILKKMKPMPSTSGQCIYRVPECLRETNPKAYVPQVVSIGPFHHGKETLKDMDDQKNWYLHALMSRANDPGKKLKECVNAIRNLEKDARKCYAEPIHLTSDEFVEMMLFDGCFIIELLLINGEVVRANDNDRITHTDWIQTRIRSDLLLLENQLPYIVIECLFKKIRDLVSLAPQSFNHLLIPYFNIFLPVHIYEPKSDIKGRHILEIMLKHLVPSKQGTRPNNIKPEKWKCDYLLNQLRKFLHMSPRPQQKKYEEEEEEVGIPCIQSATQLQEAGVKFQKKSGIANLMDIRFSDGVLEIAPISFELHTEIIFRNLIAFERCDADCGKMITSYVMFLDCLVNSSEDVDFLSKKGIIINWLNDNKATAHIINNLSKPWELDSIYQELLKKVDAYYQTDWHKWGATLKRNYFNTPWTSMSVFAAIVLLLLTFTQTIFSGLPYVHYSYKSS